MVDLAQYRLTPAEQILADVFERHVHTEIGEHDPDAAITTMTESPHLVNVPVLTGGNGRAGVRAFYASEFIARHGIAGNIPHNWQGANGRRIDFQVHAYNQDAVDVARYRANWPPGRNSDGTRHSR